MSDSDEIRARNTQKQAMNAIEKDDRQALKELLNYSISNDAECNYLGETTVVDEKTGYTLLQFAAKQRAVRCIRLLLRSPYEWNPDMKNFREETALDIAVNEGFLPVLIHLALHSRSHYPEGNDHDDSVVHGDLMLILRDNIKRMCHPERYYDPYGQVWWIWNTTHLPILFDSVDWQLKIRNALLLFEMEISIKLKENTLFPKQFWPWRMPKCHDATGCKIYPNCMFEVKISNEYEEFTDIFDNWKAHRLTDVRNHEYADIAIKDKGEDRFLWAPMRLNEQCRAMIRSLLVVNILECVYGEKTFPPHITNYFQNVHQLKIPMAMKYYLCYEDLWPILPSKD